MFLSLALALTPPADLPKVADATLTDLGDGFVRVESATYEIEVPKGFKVTEETSFGQRKAYPADDPGGELGVMTAPASRTSWESLYRTSLYFILREEDGTPTPYEVTKREDGLEAATFGVKDASGFLARRYVLLKATDGRLLALSVRIPDKAAEEKWADMFDRMVRTARFK